MIHPDLPAKLTQIIGKRVRNLLRSAAWNRPAHRVSRKPEHQGKCRRDRRFQWKKRVRGDPSEKSARAFALEDEFRQQRRRTKRQDSKVRERCRMFRPMQHWLQEL